MGSFQSSTSTSVVTRLLHRPINYTQTSNFTGEIPPFDTNATPLVIVEIALAVIGGLLAAVAFGYACCQEFVDTDDDAPVITPGIPAPPRKGLLSPNSTAGHSNSFDGENHNSSLSIFVASLRTRKSKDHVRRHKTYSERWSSFAAPLLLFVLMLLTVLTFESIWGVFDTAHHDPALFKSPGDHSPFKLYYDRAWERGLRTFYARILVSIAGAVSASLVWYITMTAFLLDFLPYLRWLFFLLFLAVPFGVIMLEQVDLERKEKPSSGQITSLRVVLYVLEVTLMVVFFVLFRLARGLRDSFTTSTYEGIAMHISNKNRPTNSPTRRGRLYEAIGTTLHRLWYPCGNPGEITLKHVAEMQQTHAEHMRQRASTGQNNCIPGAEHKGRMIEMHRSRVRGLIGSFCVFCVVLCTIFYVLASIYRQDLLHDEERWYRDAQKKHPFIYPGTRAEHNPNTPNIAWLDDNNRAVLPIPGFPMENNIFRFILICVTFFSVFLTLFLPVRGLGNLVLIWFAYIVVLVIPWALMTRWDFAAISLALEQWCWDFRKDEDIPVAVWENVTIFTLQDEEADRMEVECINIPYLSIAVLDFLLFCCLGLFVLIETLRAYKRGGCRLHGARLRNQYRIPHGAEPRYLHAAEISTHESTCPYGIVVCSGCWRQMSREEYLGHYPDRCAGPGEQTRQPVALRHGGRDIIPREGVLLVTSNELPDTFDMALGDKTVEAQIADRVNEDVRASFPYLTVGHVSLIKLTQADKAQMKADAVFNNLDTAVVHAENASTAALVTVREDANKASSSSKAFKPGRFEKKIVERQCVENYHNNLVHHYWRPIDGKLWHDCDAHLRISSDTLETKNRQTILEILVIAHDTNGNVWKEPYEKVLHGAFETKRRQMQALIGLVEYDNPWVNLYSLGAHGDHPGDENTIAYMVTFYASLKLFLEATSTRVIKPLYRGAGEYADRTCITILKPFPVLFQLATQTDDFLPKLEAVWDLFKFPASITLETFSVLVLFVGYEYERYMIAEYIQIIHTYITNKDVLRQLRICYEEYKEVGWCPGLQRKTQMIIAQNGKHPLQVRQSAAFPQKLYGFWHYMLHIQVNRTQFYEYKQCLPWGSYPTIMLYFCQMFSSSAGFLQLQDVEAIVLILNMDPKYTRTIWGLMHPTEEGVTFNQLVQAFSSIEQGKVATTEDELTIGRLASKEVAYDYPNMYYKYDTKTKVAEASTLVLFYVSFVVTLLLSLSKVVPALNAECDDDEPIGFTELLLWTHLGIALIFFILTDIGFLIEVFILVKIRPVLTDEMAPRFVQTVSSALLGNTGRLRADLRHAAVRHSNFDKEISAKNVAFWTDLATLAAKMKLGLIFRTLVAFNAGKRFRFPVNHQVGPTEPFIVGTISLVFLWSLPGIVFTFFSLYGNQCRLFLTIAHFGIATLSLIVELILLSITGSIVGASRATIYEKLLMNQRARGLRIPVHMEQPPPFPEIYTLMKDTAAEFVNDWAILPAHIWKKLYSAHNLHIVNRMWDRMDEMKGVLRWVPPTPVMPPRGLRYWLRPSASEDFAWVGPKKDHKKRPAPHYDQQYGPLFSPSPKHRPDPTANPLHARANAYRVDAGGSLYSSADWPSDNAPLFPTPAATVTR